MAWIPKDLGRTPYSSKDKRYFCIFITNTDWRIWSTKKVFSLIRLLQKDWQIHSKMKNIPAPLLSNWHDLEYQTMIAAKANTQWRCCNNEILLYVSNRCLVIYFSGKRVYERRRPLYDLYIQIPYDCIFYICICR